MNSEAEIKSFVLAKHLQKNFDTLFEAKIQSYGNRNDLVFAACRIVHKMCKNNAKLQLIADVCSRALLSEVNRLMDINYDSSLKPAEAIRRAVVAENTLARRYEFLALLFQDFPDVERECLLTAFSLRPDRQTYTAVGRCARKLWPVQQICEAADLKTIVSNHGTRRQHSIERHLRECYDANNQNAHYDPFAMPAHFYDNRQLQKVITAPLADDLMNLVHVLRIKTLTWSVGSWNDFDARCRALMCDKAKMKKHFVAIGLSHAHQQLRFVRAHQDEIDRRVYQQRVTELCATKAAAVKRKYTGVSDPNQGFLGFKRAAMSKTPSTD